MTSTLSAALLLFLILDPLGNIPVFLSLLTPLPPGRRRIVLLRELLIALGVLFGFLSRFSAAAQILIMLGAIVKVHAANGFFLGAKPGFEYNLALIGLLLPVVIAGPGRFSLARILPLPYREITR